MGLRQLVGHFARIAAVVGTGLAMVGLGTMPADAVTKITAYGLHIDRAAPCTFTVQMAAHLPMDLYDATGYLNNGARIEFRIYGQDTWSNDFLYGPVSQGSVQTHAELNGIHSHALLTLGCSTLDEDWKDIDEIYFVARFVDGDGHAIQASSPVTRGEYHF